MRVGGLDGTRAETKLVSFPCVSRPPSTRTRLLNWLPVDLVLLLLLLFVINYQGDPKTSDSAQAPTSLLPAPKAPGPGGPAWPRWEPQSPGRGVGVAAPLEAALGTATRAPRLSAVSPAGVVGTRLGPG